MTSTAPQVHCKTSGETRFVSVDFGDSTTDDETGKLSNGELLTGTPIVGIEDQTTGSTDVTTANAAVNTSTVNINGRDAIAGEAVQFTVAGGDDAAYYVLTVLCGTDASPAQTLEGFVRIEVTDT